MEETNPEHLPGVLPCGSGHLDEVTDAGASNSKPSTVTVPSKRTKANRLDALKSTGPKTSEGKRRSSRNAIKHGLFSKEILAGCTPEESQEYFRLLAAQRKDMGPVGAVEDMLVERIAVALFRWKHVLRYELQGTQRAKSIAGIPIPEHSQDPELFDLVCKDPEQALDLIHRALFITRSVLQDILIEGRFTWSDLDQLNFFPGGLHRRLRAMLAFARGYTDAEHVIVDLPPNPAPHKPREYPTGSMATLTRIASAKLKSELADVPSNFFTDKQAQKGFVPSKELASAEEANLKAFIEADHSGPVQKIAIEVLGDELKSLMEWRKICLTLRVPERRAQLLRPNFLDKEHIELVSRCETTLWRQIDKALDQFERWQRQRRGEAVPPPVNAHLTVD